MTDHLERAAAAAVLVTGLFAAVGHALGFVTAAVVLTATAAAVLLVAAFAAPEDDADGLDPRSDGGTAPASERDRESVPQHPMDYLGTRHGECPDCGPALLDNFDGSYYCGKCGREVAQ